MRPNYARRSRPFMQSAGRTAYRAAQGLARALPAIVAARQQRAAFTPQTRSRPIVNQTPGGTVSRVRKLGAAQSRMAGFIRRGKKYKRTRRNTMSIRGVNLVKEAGGVVDAKKCAYVGHGSVPLITLRRVIWRAVFKRLYEKIFGVSPETLAFAILQNGDRVVMDYKLAGTGNISFQYLATGAYTITQLADYWAQDGRPWRVLDDEVQLYKIVYIPAAATAARTAMIRLLDSTITVSCKATLKMQNRTINSLGTEADEVDNVPLNGYYYSGRGAGPIFKNWSIGQDAADFTVGNVNGVKVYAANTNANDGLQEPPLAGDFSYVNRTGKVRFNPGDVKTSVLSSYIKKDFNKLHKDTQWSYNAAPQSHSGVGSYRLFAVEKMIETAADPGTQPSILVAWEHNFRMMATITEKYSFNTVQEYEYN